ncbi:hypothetical protein CG716_05430 [Mycolicibacterium sphagni]|uniref:Uncharacterized protein n=2 Tax=Mycolicibacterium sphagni TaxID=1786 RepID=A0A255DRB5_9MYCO|nr:hypothetical protein CG716_05430 [Mycolicibacterium sphagni]
MFSVLEELAGGNAAKYRGRVQVWPVGEAASWSLELHDAKDRLTQAVIGDHLILTYGLLVKVTDEEYREGA